MSTQTIGSTQSRPTSARATASGTARAASAKRSLHSVPVEVSSPWAGRQSPCTAAEENAFVLELEILSGITDVDEFERRDVTVLLTALRSGITPTELLSQAPGVKPARLLAAHRELDGRRLLAEHAWRTIVLDPSLLTFETFAPCASELLPAVTSHLATYRHDHEQFVLAIEDAADQVMRTSRRVLVLEQRLGEASTDTDKARELGTLLYDIYGKGAWSLPTFLPPRVGALVPLRVGALLGDDIAAHRRAS